MTFSDILAIGFTAAACTDQSNYCTTTTTYVALSLCVDCCSGWRQDRSLAPLETGIMEPPPWFWGWNRLSENSLTKTGFLILPFHRRSVLIYFFHINFLLFSFHALERTLPFCPKLQIRWKIWEASPPWQVYFISGVVFWRVTGGNCLRFSVSIENDSWWCVLVPTFDYYQVARLEENEVGRQKFQRLWYLQPSLYAGSHAFQFFWI